MLELFTKYGQAIVTMLRSKVAPYSATGKTEQSLRFDASPLGLTIYGRQFFQTIETGRGPRKSNSYGGFDKGLEDYLQARGLQTKKSKSGVTYYFIGKSWMTAKSLALKINREGDNTFKAGGRMVYSDELYKMVESLTKEVSKSMTTFMFNQIKDSFNVTIHR